MHKKKFQNYKYLEDLTEQILDLDTSKINKISQIFLKKFNQKKNIFICGNGGSAANADHISNDLMLGLNKRKKGVKIISLNSNIPKLTCIANDIGYDSIYSHQLNLLGSRGDLLIVLSGSGNSKNIINALRAAKKKKMFSFGLLGYDGGKSIKLCDDFIHFRINDMQVSEDLQLITMNQVMKILSKQPKIEKF
tara:strand:+ start:23 stop:601 length:579 start_codon:yes stop_codon:yes gene_type:complete